MMQPSLESKGDIFNIRWTFLQWAELNWISHAFYFSKAKLRISNRMDYAPKAFIQFEYSVKDINTFRKKTITEQCDFFLLHNGMFFSLVRNIQGLLFIWASIKRFKIIWINFSFYLNLLLREPFSSKIRNGMTFPICLWSPIPGSRDPWVGWSKSIS